MATKKQKREAAIAKREAFLEEERLRCAQILEREQERRKLEKAEQLRRELARRDGNRAAMRKIAREDIEPEMAAVRAIMIGMADKLRRDLSTLLEDAFSTDNDNGVLRLTGFLQVPSRYQTKVTNNDAS